MASTDTYSTFPTLTPSKNDRVVGILTSSGDIYCRRCVEKLGLKYEDGAKYITRSRASSYIYNCIDCGWRLTTKRTTMYI
jgi:hypothetical protein